MKLPPLIQKLIDTPLIPVQGSWIDASVFIVIFILLGVSFWVNQSCGNARLKGYLRFLIRFISFCVFVFLFFKCICILRNPVAGASQIGWDDLSAFSNFFLFALVAGFVLIAGNIYCGWMCPLGFLQDISGRPSRLLSRPIKIILLFLIFALQIYFMYVTRPATGFFTESVIALWSMGLLIIMALIFFYPRFQGQVVKIRYVSMFLYVLITGAGVWFSEAWCWLTGSDIDYSSVIAFITIFLASVIIPMAWCRFLCPTGTFLSFLGRRSFCGCLKDDDAVCEASKKS